MILVKSKNRRKKIFKRQKKKHWKRKKDGLKDVKRKKIKKKEKEKNHILVVGHRVSLPDIVHRNSGICASSLFLVQPMKLDLENCKPSSLRISLVPFSRFIV